MYDNFSPAGPAPMIPSCAHIASGPSGRGGAEGLGDPVGGEAGGVGLVVGVDVFDAALVLGEDLEFALGAGRGLLVAAVGVGDGDLPVVRAVGDQVGHGDLLDHAVEGDAVPELLEV